MSATLLEILSKITCNKENNKTMAPFCSHIFNKLQFNLHKVGVIRKLKITKYTFT